MKLYKKIELKTYKLKPVLVISLAGHQEVSDELEELINKDIPLSIDIKEIKDKRSLRANAYYWHLLGQISLKLTISQEELHKKFLREYGKPDVIALKTDVDVSRYFKYYDLLKIGKKYKTYKIYQNSSDMDTKEFSKLLSGVVQEAKDIGIQTLNDLEIEGMIKERKKDERKL